MDTTMSTMLTALNRWMYCILQPAVRRQDNKAIAAAAGIQSRLIHFMPKAIFNLFPFTTNTYVGRLGTLTLRLTDRQTIWMLHEPFALCFKLRLLMQQEQQHSHYSSCGFVWLTNLNIGWHQGNNDDDDNVALTSTSLS